MATLGTILFTWFKGELVGRDEFGNRYYCERGKPTRARRRRWVMYEGAPEASKVPPLWHAWLHHVAEIGFISTLLSARPVPRPKT